MPIDASIYGQVQQPQQPNQLATLAQAYQIKGLQRQGEQADMAAQQQNKLLQLVGDPSFSQLPVDQRAAQLQGIGAFDQAGKLVTATAAANKDQRAADKDELSMSIDRYQNASGAFAEIAKNPASAPQMLMTLVQAKVITPDYAQKVLSSAAQAPDPAQFWMQGANAAISAKDKLTAQIQQQGQAVTMRGQDMTQSTALQNNASTVGATLRGQDLTAATAQAGQGVTIRGQDLANQRAIDANSNKPLNDTQAKALQFGSRMQAAEDIFGNLAGQGTTTSVPGSRTPVLGAVVNALQPEKQQQLDQAKRDFINAVLRRESGAAISPSEFDNAEKQYFPQPNEGPTQQAQKKANRELATRGILAEVPDSDRRVSDIRYPGGVGKPAAAPAKPDLSSMEAELKRRGLLK